MILGLLLAVSNPLAGSSFKGVILKGIVVENEPGGPPIENVQISAQDGANSVVSLSNGTFVLEVAKQPGERVRLILQKPGMEVINDWEREFNLPRPETAAPLTFLLCRKVDIPEMKCRYYRLCGVDRPVKNYKKKFEDSEAKRRAAEAETKLIRTQLDQVTKAAAANKEARLKAGELSGSDVLRVPPIDRSHDAMILLLQARLYRDDNGPREALVAYDEALKVSLELAQKEPFIYLTDVIDSLNNRGDLLNEQNRLAEALKDFDDALKTSSDWAEKSPTYLPYVAMTQGYRAALFRKQKRAGDERAALDDALRLYRGLARSNPSYRLQLAETLNKCGINNLDEKRREEKRQAFNEALSIYQTLEREHPGEYKQQVESTRTLLEEFFEATLEGYGELPKLDPGSRPNVAETLSDLGDLNLAQNRIGKARKHFSGGFGLYVILAKENVGQYGQRALSIEGILLSINPGPYQKEFESNGIVLVAAFNDSLKSYRDRAQTDPIYWSNVAETLVSLGKLARDQNRIADARDDFGQALAIFEPLSRAEKQHLGPASWYGPQYDAKVKSTRRLLDDLMEIRKP